MQKIIPFNVPLVTGNEQEYVSEVIHTKKFCGDGIYTKKCNDWFEKNVRTKKGLLTTSCTHALELSALLCNIKKGDEVIMPSYTFVSTANAFVLRGAKIIFVDIRPDTMNIDETKIEDSITENTKMIVPVHYAGVGCEMDMIMEIADEYDLFVVEDAAQGVMADYKGKPLGSIGHIGCFSFHETKNYQCGEGGAILLNDDKFIERAEIIREKGTNRSLFIQGMVDKYTWVDIGSSYLPSELNASFLYSQLEMSEEINRKRLRLWNEYYNRLKGFEIPKIPSHCHHNAHMFYIKLKDINERTRMIDHLKKNGIQSVFHYVPLHSSKMGIQSGEFTGTDMYTTKESERLLRLPMHCSLSIQDVGYICDKVKEFFD